MSEPVPADRPAPGQGYRALVVGGVLLGAMATALWLVASYAPADHWGEALERDGVIVHHGKGVGAERAERIALVLLSDEVIRERADARASMAGEALVIDLFQEEDRSLASGRLLELRLLRARLEKEAGGGAPVVLRLCHQTVRTNSLGRKAAPRPWKTIEE
ncbi:MAG: hypothetical protein K2W96_18605 [Gemmataceae bacterium]|nr:hypothetical protein [Gemmataceae bacterium]